MVTAPPDTAAVSIQDTVPSGPAADMEAAPTPEPGIHAEALRRELDWFQRVLDVRLRRHFDKPGEIEDPWLIEPPVHPVESYYGHLVAHYQFIPLERAVLCLALAPQLRPHLLDVFFTRNSTFDREFTEFGGTTDGSGRGFQPTGETALFVLAGDDLKQRLAVQSLFDPEHIFSAHDVLTLDETGVKDNPWTGALRLSDEIADLVTRGFVRKPKFGTNFPAKEISTGLEWDDLVLPVDTMEQVLDIKAWIQHGETMLGELELGRRLKPGFRTLFFGPPGTGKTLTATLLGKITGLPVYRIDLSMVVSKYIGETEKNLERVFSKAEHRNWILFFDEADALFGKRTQVSDAHDRFANQEVSYLLQRVEDYAGVVILASNLKTNLDEAFTRRFQSTILFPLPGESERLSLWRTAFSAHTELAPDISLEDIAAQYELSGGAIQNVVRYATLQALNRGARTIRAADVQQGVRKEFQKEGRTL